MDVNLDTVPMYAVVWSLDFKEKSVVLCLRGFSPSRIHTSSLFKLEVYIVKLIETPMRMLQRADMRLKDSVGVCTYT